MENLNKKAAFLRNKFVPLVSSIPTDTPAKFGKMNVPQMIEHMSYSFRQANGKDTYELTTAQEYLPRMQAFLMSEKPFKENTPNSLLPDDPEPPKHEHINDAYNELRQEISDFFKLFDKEPDKKLMNPFFGELDYDMWIQLLHKHAWHHLKQFGVDEL